MMAMYERVVLCVSKPPEERDGKMIQLLLPWFRKRSELFAALKDDVVVDIIRNCEFSTRHRDNVIIKQGDKGNCFFIILRGKVGIYINNAISDDDDATNSLEKLQEAQDKAKATNAQLDRSLFGNFIASIEAGKSFGELALISNECIRNASIIAQETVDLLVVNRALYNRSLKAAQTAEFQERTRFVAETPMFRHWQPKYKRQMAFSIRKVLVPFDEPIVKQGDHVGALFFLRSGQAKLVIDPDQHASQYPTLHPSDGAEDVADDDIIIPKKKETVQVEDKVAVPPFAARRREIKKKTVEISIVRHNEIIGDVEFVLDLKTYLQSVICTEACQLYALDMKNYERLIMRRNPKTVDLIQESALTKLQSRVSRLPDRQIPLLKSLLIKLASKNRTKKRDNRDSHNKGRSGAVSVSWDEDFIPQRGPLIDIHGPGTVFHHIRQREQARRRAKHKVDTFRGARVGFALHSLQLQGPILTADPGTDRNSLVHQSLPEFSSSDRDVAMDTVSAHVMQRPHTTANTPLWSDHPFFADSPHHQVAGDNTSPVDLQTHKRIGMDGFSDFTSSDKALADLEERIRAWHTDIYENTDRPKTVKPTTFKMRRVELEAIEKPLKPGVKVVLRKKKKRRPAGLESIFQNSNGETGNDKDENTSGLSKCGRSHSTSSDLDACPHCKALSTQLEKHPTKFLFRLTKPESPRQYTEQEYKELKKVLAWRERANGPAGASHVCAL